jgi:hypothetical protein
VAHGLEAIDWRAPWLAGWSTAGKKVAEQVAAGASVAQALNVLNVSSAGVSKTFVPQADLPHGVAYEQFIFDTHRVPTRDGLHDFFNGLAWLHFPRTKLHLNALQAAQILQTGIQPARGPARDALTVFDENAALLQAPDGLWQALVDKDWGLLFGGLRPLWQSAQLIIFGHALQEKLVQPRKPMTAHVYRVQAPGLEWADVDAWLADSLNARTLASKPFAHLPVLGVPGWWPDNEDPVFYADRSVFRAPRPSPEP